MAGGLNVVPQSNDNHDADSGYDSINKQVAAVHLVNTQQDSNGYYYGEQSVYVNDGSNVTQGFVADAAWSGTGNGTVVAILKGVYNRVGSGGSGTTTITEASGYVGSTSPPTATTAGADTSYTFSAQVNNVTIENNTSANVNYAFDTTASPGSMVLVPGAHLEKSKKVTVVHLWTAAVQTINGSSAGCIIVLGAL